MAKRPTFTPPATCPKVGSTIIFDTVPVASYCRPGETYKVTHGPRSARDTFRFERVGVGSATNDPVWSVARSTFTVVAEA